MHPHPAGTLPVAVHDAAAASLGTSTYVLGGGSPDTVATVKAVPTPCRPDRDRRSGNHHHRHSCRRLPTPRSDLAVATVGTGRSANAYVVGGYDGTTYQPAVLATADGTHFTTVGQLTVPVRYPAVVAQGGLIYALGGQIASPGVAVSATDAIQVVDPTTHRSKVVAHLPEALYGAAAFVIDGTIYVAGGQVPERPDPDHHRRVRAHDRQGPQCRAARPGRGIRGLHDRRCRKICRRVHRRW